MKNNNKAFSLVELIVAIGMFAIVGAMIVSIVAVSSRTYKSVSAEVDVQEEAQLTLNQIKDLVIDANRAVVYGLEVQEPSNIFVAVDETNTEADILTQWSSAGVDEDSILRVLVIYSEKSCNTTQADGSILTTYTYPIIKIIYDQNKSEVYYAEFEFPNVASIDISSFGILNTNDVYLLSEYVTDFNVDLANIENSQVDLQVNFSSASKAGEGREYFSTPTINLRNKVIASENKSEIYIDSEVGINSYVLGIDIKKDDVVINEDTIQLGHSMKYTAEVDVKYGASDACMWSLTGDDSAIPSWVTGTGEVMVPSNEYSGTLMLTATAMGDLTKIASIPITISAGVTPTSIDIVSSSLETVGGTAEDVRLVYTFTATTSYTDLTTTVGENITWIVPTNLPTGAFISYSESGQLLLHLRENGGMQAYEVSVEASDLNAAGEVVKETITVDPDDLTFEELPPMKAKITPGNTSLSRGDEIEFTAAVLDFTGNMENLDYTWEIVELSSSIVDKVHLTNIGSTGKQKKLTIDKDLDWSSKYEIIIRVTVKDEEPGEEQQAFADVTVTIYPVVINIKKTSADHEGWYFRGVFTYEIENVILTEDDWEDDVEVDPIISATGIRRYNGQEEDFSDEQIIRCHADKIDKDAKEVTVKGYRWINSYQIIKANVQLQVDYMGNSIQSDKLIILDEE